MTVTELIEVLKQRPPTAPVYVWDTAWSFSKVEVVSEPAGEKNIHTTRSKLPVGAVVLWGAL